MKQEDPSLADEIVVEMREHLSGDLLMQAKLESLVNILNQAKIRKDEQEEELTVIHNTQENLLIQLHDADANITRLNGEKE